MIKLFSKFLILVSLLGCSSVAFADLSEFDGTWYSQLNSAYVEITSNGDFDATLVFHDWTNIQKIYTADGFYNPNTNTIYTKIGDHKAEFSITASKNIRYYGVGDTQELIKAEQNSANTITGTYASLDSEMSFTVKPIGVNQVEVTFYELKLYELYYQYENFKSSPVYYEILTQKGLYNSERKELIVDLGKNKKARINLGEKRAITFLAQGFKVVNSEELTKYEENSAHSIEGTYASINSDMRFTVKPIGVNQVEVIFNELSFYDSGKTVIYTTNRQKGFFNTKTKEIILTLDGRKTVIHFEKDVTISIKRLDFYSSSFDFKKIHSKAIE